MSYDFRAHYINASNKKLFFKRVARHVSRQGKAYRRIRKVDELLEWEFRNHVRESGQPGIVHHRSVMLILLELFHVRDLDVLVAALLHDLIEDVKGWSRSRIAQRFNGHIASLVWWNTKDALDAHDGSRKDRDAAFRAKQWRAPRKAAQIKNSDRLDALHTLMYVKREKQERKERETRHFYLRWAKKNRIPTGELERALRMVQRDLLGRR